MSLEQVLTEAITPKIQDKTRVLLRRRAQDVMKECRKAATSAITDFYMAYTPEVYTRQYSFYQSPYVYLHKRNENKYTIEIFFSDNLGGQHHDPDTYIYNRVIYAGIHGSPNIHISTPIWEIFGTWLDFRFSKR